MQRNLPAATKHDVTLEKLLQFSDCRTVVSSQGYLSLKYDPASYRNTCSVMYSCGYTAALKRCPRRKNQLSPEKAFYSASAAAACMLLAPDSQVIVCVRECAGLDSTKLLPVLMSNQ